MIQSLQSRADWYEMWNTIGAYFVHLAFIYLRIIKKTHSMSSLALGFSSKMSRLGEKNTIFKPFGNIAFLAIIECLLLYFYQYYIPSVFISSFSNWFDTGANYFGLLFTVPIILFIFCCVIWMNPLKQTDLVTPVYPLTLAITKIACAGSGCCHGMAWSNGVMNYKWARCEVPIQLIESAVAFLIFIFLLCYERKAKPGTMYPLYMILVSGTRFLTEFLRGEDNLWGPFKKYHLFCFIGVIYGVFLLVVALKFGNKFTKLFDESTYFTKGRFHQNVKELRNTIESKEIKKTGRKEKASLFKTKKESKK